MDSPLSANILSSVTQLCVPVFTLGLGYRLYFMLFKHTLSNSLKAHFRSQMRKIRNFSSDTSSHLYISSCLKIPILQVKILKLHFYIPKKKEKKHI